MSKEKLTSIKSGEQLPNGVAIYNTTPHYITFWLDDWTQPVSVEPGELLNAKASEVVIEHTDGIEYVRTVFDGTDDGKATIAQIKEDYHGVVIVGSIIAAQAYGYDVVSMVPHPDFVRVPPADKRMLPNKFNKFNF